MEDAGRAPEEDLLSRFKELCRELAERGIDARELLDTGKGPGLGGIDWKCIPDSIPGHVMVLDRKGTIVYINHTVPDLSPQEVEGTSVFDHLTHDSRELFRERLSRIIASGEPDALEVEYKSKNKGDIQVFESQVGPVLREGNVEGFVVHSRDITGYKNVEEALQASETFNRSIIENSRDCIKILDMEGRIEFMSPAGLVMLGLKDLSTLLGQDYLSLWHGEDARRAAEAVDRARAGEAGEFEGSLQSADGKLQWFDAVISAVPGAGGRTERLLVVSREITKRKQMEEELERRNHELVENCAKLREVEAFRDSLTHMVVHDMKTPLVTVEGFLELTLEQFADELGEDPRECVQQALTATQRLLRMTGTLLAINKLECDTIPIEKRACNVRAQADALAHSLEQFARQGEKTISVEGPEAHAYCDEEMVRRIVSNLIDNALKFSPKGSEVKVVIEADNGKVKLGVVDEGQGIAPEYRETIFDKFAQVDLRRHGKMTAYGLGLAFCKLAVEAHGGRIWLDSEPEQGSAFWIEFEAAEPA